MSGLPRSKAKTFSPLPSSTDCNQGHNSGRSAGSDEHIAMTLWFRTVQAASLLKTQNSFSSTLGRLRARLMCAPWQPLSKSDTYITIWGLYRFVTSNSAWRLVWSLLNVHGTNLQVASLSHLPRVCVCTVPDRATWEILWSRHVTMMPSPSCLDPRHPMQPITTTYTTAKLIDRYTWSQKRKAWKRREAVPWHAAKK